VTVGGPRRLSPAGARLRGGASAVDLDGARRAAAAAADELDLKCSCPASVIVSEARS
jgi:hypothetical protein